MGTCFSSSASRHFSFLFLPSEPPCLSLVAFSLFLAVLFLVSFSSLHHGRGCCGGCGRPSHYGRSFLWWVQRPTNGTPVSRLCPTVKRDSGLSESRFTPQPTTKPRTPGQGERTESQEANGASRLSSIVKRRQQQRLGRNNTEFSAVAVRGWSRRSRPRFDAP